MLFVIASYRERFVPLVREGTRNGHASLATVIRSQTAACQARITRPEA